MIKTYSIDDGSEFKTVILPAGTLLFRGSGPDDLFREYNGLEDNYCMSPTSQVFFYPAPYVSQSVNNYSIHTIYTSNYDLELILMIKPASMYKSDENNKQSSSIVKICSDISAIDECGFAMSRSDPCFTTKLLKDFPNILGYIGLDRRDISKFMAQYPIYLKLQMHKHIMKILPSVVSNSREVTGVPEIVIHPLHLRGTDDDMRREFKHRTLSAKNIKIHRAKYNFTPLLYITNDDIFSLNSLNNMNIQRIKQTDPPEYISNNNLFNNIEKVMNALLASGYTIDGVLYSAIVDSKTGFYTIKQKSMKNTTRKSYNTIMKVFDPETMITDATPLTYSLSDSWGHEKILKMANSDEGLSTNERVLNSNGASLSPEYIFNKGNYIKKYRVATIFPRPDLGSQFQYKRKSLQTRKIK